MFQYITRGGHKRYIRTAGNVRKLSNNCGGNRVGAFAAVEGEDGNIYIGWSLCQTKLDKFDKNLAVSIAKGRAMRGCTDPLEILPASIRVKAKAFIRRAERYYKGKQIIPAFSWGPSVNEKPKRNFIIRLIKSMSM